MRLSPRTQNEAALHVSQNRRPETRPSLRRPILLDRDHSILAFNERVLDWAERPEVPLIERLRYLCIVSSNLDEFFEVRAAPHLTAAQRRRRARATTRSQSFEALAEAAHALVARQYALYNDELMPAFADAGHPHHLARRAQPGAAQVGAASTSSARCGRC